MPLAGAPHQAAQPRRNLVGIIGFDETIIGSGVQPGDAIVPFGIGRRHQRWHAMPRQDRQQGQAFTMWQAANGNGGIKSRTPSQSWAAARQSWAAASLVAAEAGSIRARDEATQQVAAARAALAAATGQRQAPGQAVAGLGDGGTWWFRALVLTDSGIQFTNMAHPNTPSTTSSTALAASTSLSTG